MCLYPRLIDNRKYKANKKNGGIIPPLTDVRTRYVPIGCQTCIECRKQKAREWQVRLLEEIKDHNNGKFVTLTLSNESIKEIIKGDKKLQELNGYDLDNGIATRAMRLFLERWRKRYKKSLRHWTVTELGHEGTENIHLHGIVWTNDIEALKEIWKYGHVWAGYETKNGKLNNYVNEKTVNYIIKYISKIDTKHLAYKSKILTSPGIGNGYFKRPDFRNNRYKKGNTNETYRTRTGHKIALPIYYRNKIYTEKEKENLWIEKLDKEERFVCGEKVSTKNDLKHYLKLVEYHRRKMIQQGYKPPEFIWKAKVYEEQRRKMMYEKRLTTKETDKKRSFL